MVVSKGSQTQNTLTQTVDFIDFLDLITIGNVLDAAVILTQVFGLSLKQCQECAQVFQSRLTEDQTSFLQKALQIRKKIFLGGYNDALTLIFECFNIQGPDAICALETFRKNSKTLH